MGREQFIAIPGVFMGALRGVATEWNGVKIFAPTTNTAGQPRLSSAFRSSFARYLAPYLEVLKRNGVAPRNRELKLLDEPHFDLRNQTVLEQAVVLYRFVKATCAPFGGCCIRSSGFYIPAEIAALLGPEDIWDANSDSLSAHAKAYAAAVAESGVRLTICEFSYSYCMHAGRHSHP
jgi:hypothetical protein